MKYSDYWYLIAAVIAAPKLTDGGALACVLCAIFFSILFLIREKRRRD